MTSHSDAILSAAMDKFRNIIRVDNVILVEEAMLRLFETVYQAGYDAGEENGWINGYDDCAANGREG